MADDVRALIFTDSENKEQLNNIRLVCEDIIQNCLYELGYKDFNYIRPLQWNYILMEIQRIIKDDKCNIKMFTTPAVITFLTAKMTAFSSESESIAGSTEYIK